jgi:hypothetical protein
MKIAAILGACGLALAAGGAQAKDEATTADVRCLVAMSALGASNPTYKQPASIGVFYFLGRIEGRAPNFPLAEAIRSESASANQASLAEEIKRCGGMISAKVQALQVIGESMKGPPGH